MACGGCGHGLFRMFNANEDTGGMEGYVRLLAECSSCKSVSVIQPSPPLMTIGWGEGAEGRLCNMAPTSP